MSMDKKSFYGNLVTTWTSLSMAAHYNFQC